MRTPLELGLLLRHPWATFGVVFGAVVLTGPILQNAVAGRFLRRPVVPRSPIVAWERAGTKLQMDRILDAWGSGGRRWARFSLVADAAFLVTYGSLLSFSFTLAAAFFSRGRAPVGEWIAIVLAWGAFVPSAFDMAEDVFLWTMLRPYEGDRLPSLMHSVSTWKWKLVAGAVPLAAIALLVALMGCPFHC